ncbi:CHAT domain-containing protein [Spirulina major CS-329]|uniref:CHAT domain-containing protein n=1 Tax=Spirulina TaxID=1154 RepID=UPI00232D9E67|nr:MULTISPECIES: CHAT domain-containing protein [Spirulina]MDB9495654.1 CHAT domain-containing protein [Spirulina subsalsa CS-330]MDB9505302.1 CHAT domain-containing protein [Spirulina major CS-329]
MSSQFWGRRVARSVVLSVVLWGAIQIPALAQPSSNSYLEQLTTTYQQMLDGFPAQRAAAEAAQNPRELGRLWMMYGIAHQYFGRFEEAQQGLERALVLMRETGDVSEAAVVQQLAAVHAQQGDPYGIAFLEGQLRQPLAVASRRAVLYQLGIAYLSLGDRARLPRGIAVMEEYLAGLDVEAEPDYWIGVVTILAALQYLVNPGEAIATLQGAIASHQSLLAQRAQWTSFTSQLARYLHQQQRGLEAIAVVEAALATLPTDANPHVPQARWQLLGLLADLQADQEQFAVAHRLHRERLTLAQSLAPHNATHLSLTWAALAQTAFWQGNLAEALQFQTEAYGQYGLSPDPQQWRETDLTALVQGSDRLQHLGFLQWQAGQLAQAEATLRQGLAMDHEARRMLLDNTNFYAMTRDELTVTNYGPSTDGYRTLQQVLVAQGQPEAALVAAEAGRARALLQLLINRQAHTNQYIDVQTLTLAQIKAIARREKTTLVQYSVVYDAPFTYRIAFADQNPEVVTSTILIWVITPDGEIHHRTVPLDQSLSLLVERARNRIISSDRANRAGPPLQDLHRLLIDPIAPLLPTDPAARVTFIPQDMLFFVPFPALQDANGVELIDRHTILTAPSIQVLDVARRMKERLPPRDQALVVGNPTMPPFPGGTGTTRNALAPLPGAEAEAKAIATLFQTEPLIGDQATEAEAIAGMQNARIIHLATHGLLDADLRYGSSLALAPTRDTDGFLTLREINQLNLKADLAVLSACDTGRGWIGLGDGVIGLSRSFIGAGAASVMVSLWAIPDQPTATLMTEFYNNLNAGQDGAKALREAMLTTRDRYPSPSAWAAFTLTGAVD